MRVLPFVVVVLAACSEQGVSVHDSNPSVTITSHQDGDLVLDGVPTEFRAQVGDADDAPDEVQATWYAGGELACAKAYADPDGLTTCEATLSSLMDQPIVRVEVSDPSGGGAFDEVEVAVAPVDGPESDAPEVSWIAPEDGGTSTEGPIVFEVHVDDREDAPTDLALTFTSSIDGQFSTQGADSAGTAQFVYDGLSPGEHVLTVRATDSDGLWTEDLILHTVEEESTVFVPDYNGLFDVDPAIHYDCQDNFFGVDVVNFNIASFTFSEAGGVLTVSGAPTTMGQNPQPVDENFSVQGVIAGGCNETYLLSGAFSDDDDFAGNFQVSFTGGQCGLTNCLDQVWAVTGTRH